MIKNWKFVKNIGFNFIDKERKEKIIIKEKIPKIVFYDLRVDNREVFNLL